MAKHLKIIETALKKEREVAKALRAEVTALRAGETYEEKKLGPDEVAEGTKAKQKRKQRYTLLMGEIANTLV